MNAVKAKKIFQEVLDRYDLKFSFQSFEKYLDFWGPMETYSIYNDNGCFTIYHAVQRGEWDYYVSSKFSLVQEELMEKTVIPYNYCKDIWQKKYKWYSSKKTVFQIISEIISKQINSAGEFFGVKVNK